MNVITVLKLMSSPQALAGSAMIAMGSGALAMDEGLVKVHAKSLSLDRYMLLHSYLSSCRVVH